MRHGTKSVGCEMICARWHKSLPNISGYLGNFTNFFGVVINNFLPKIQFFAKMRRGTESVGHFVWHDAIPTGNALKLNFLLVEYPTGRISDWSDIRLVEYPTKNTELKVAS